MGIDTAMAAKMNPKKTEKSLLLQQQHPLLQQELIFDQMKLFHISHYPNGTSLISSTLKELLPRSRSRRRQQQREWLQFFTGSLVKPMIMGVHFAKIISQFLKLNQYELTVVYEKFVRLQRRGNILEIFFLSN